MAQVIFRYLDCIRGKETEEEPFLMVYWGDGDRRRLGPYQMRRGESQYLDSFNVAGDNISFCLFECDPCHHDHYGSIRIETIDEEECAECVGPGRYIINFPSNSDVRYKLHIDIITDVGRRGSFYFLDLLSLHCHDAQQRKDKVYLKVNGEDVWGPTTMRSGNTRSLDSVREIFIPERTSVQLWEEDGSRDDYFGQLSLEIDDAFEFDTVHTHTYRRDRGIVGDIRYSLEYRITQS